MHASSLLPTRQLLPSLAARRPCSSPSSSPSSSSSRRQLVVVAAKRARGPRDGGAAGGGGKPSSSSSPPKTGGGGGGGGGSSNNSGFKSPGNVREGSAYEQETRKIILSLDKVTKSSPSGKKLLDGVGLGMYLGAKIGILGANGAGKSTLLKILAGVDDAFDGRLQVNDGIKVSYLEQEPPLSDGPTVDDNIRPALARIEGLLKDFERVSAEMAEPGADVDSLMSRMDRLQAEIDACNGWELERTLERATDALRCPPGDALVEKLSGGERRRVALARVLLESPDVLLLDEPSTHLDALSMSWLERTLAEFRGTVVAVTHDRYFLDNVAGWILELDKGKGIPFEGNYSEWLEARALREQREAKASAALGRAIDKELEFVRSKAKGQNKKGKARLRVYDELVEEQASYARQATFDSLTIPVGPRLGGVVVDVENLTKSVAVGEGGGERRLLMEDVSFSVPPGAVVGIVGGNGVGKTTLFNMLTGADAPDSGEIRIGETVKTMYVDQMRAGLDPEATVAEAIASSLSTPGSVVDPAGTISVAGRDVPVRQYCSWFNFKGQDQQKKVKVLSGGEKNRLNLARTLAGAGNLLLVDEPTNEADVFFVQALEAAIQRFAGSTMVISHDRWFLDRLATHILAFEGDSKVVWFEGGYSEYEADWRKRNGGALTPTRVKYRKMAALA